MKVLLVHGRYRSVAPSGENHVVDQEAAALSGAGHQVELFQRHSDDIAGWPLARKIAVPARSLWNGQVRKELARHLERSRPDVVHVHNTFPLISPSVLHACRDAGVPVVATLHNYKLACASGDFFREGAPCHECAGGYGAAALAHGCYRGSRVATAPVVAGLALHRSAWQELVSAFIFISASQRDLLRDLHLPADRCFVKHNFVPTVAASAHRGPSTSSVYLGRLDAAKGAPFLMRGVGRLPRTPSAESPLRLAVAGGGPLERRRRAWGGRHHSGRRGRTPGSGRGRAGCCAGRWSLWSRRSGRRPSGWSPSRRWPPAWRRSRPSRGSFPELVTDGVDGALFEPDDAGALAGVLHDVDGSPHGTSRWAARAGRRTRSASAPAQRGSSSSTSTGSPSATRSGGHRVVVS